MNQVVLSGLFTDFYELTMMQGYYLQGMHTRASVFDMFFRKLPFNGGYAVFAGLDDVLDALSNLSFSDTDISYLQGLGMFENSFLNYLSTFSFQGDVYSFQEGTLCFPLEPLMRVHATIIEAQLIESMLLNIINYQTLIATKATRIYYASGQGNIMEFGLRRAHGPNGAISASRAAYIGGAKATSNVEAGRCFNIPVTGTMAHSWIMSHEKEEEAFRNYAKLYPENSSFLLDTYDTISSGLPNAIKVGKELKAKGQNFSVRLDSGDIEYLSKEVRKSLDAAELYDARIAVSNELNEDIIQQLVTSECPIDYWGVGSEMVCAPNDAMLSGVYKLVAIERNGKMHETMKLSDHAEKASLPGIKQVYRLYSDKKTNNDDSKDNLIDNLAGLTIEADVIALNNEVIPEASSKVLYHPAADYRHIMLDNITQIKPLLQQVMSKGKRVQNKQALSKIQEHMKSNVSSLDVTYKRIINPHIFKVSISEKLRETKIAMIENKKRNITT